MNTTELLTDAFSRISDSVHGVVDGLSSRELMARVDEGSNTIAWLIWHLARVQDDHIADLMGIDQIWLSAGWVDRFRLPLPASDTGYGHSSDDVASVVVESPELLLGYFDEVHERSTHYLAGLTEAELDRVIDESWTPPVTVGVRLISVLSDDLQHAGQAAFIRGVVRRR
ncbi:MAG: DUF664 domain-containing protein [Mycetocola sp.]